MTEDVLVVEDDLDISDALRDALEDEGFSVTTARDGRQALAYLNEGHVPRLILLDLMLPIIDGEQVLGEIRASHIHAGVPVVAMTASEDRMRGSLAGVLLLRKPVRLSTLLEAVHLHVGRARRAG